VPFVARRRAKSADPAPSRIPRLGSARATTGCGQDAARRHTVVFRLNLDTETVGQMDLPMPLCVTPDVTVRSVFGQLKESNRGSASVCRDGKLVGIFTERDALKLMAAGGDLDVTIESVMTPNPATIRVTDTVESAIARMSLGGYRRLIVIDPEGRPVGLLKAVAILHYLVQHFPKFVYTLPPNPNQRPQQREGA
jgi:CBS domain-containing protein